MVWGLTSGVGDIISRTPGVQLMKRSGSRGELTLRRGLHSCKPIE